MDLKYTNDLANETSPYLLQHANNPVNWLPWGNKAFELANQQNKLMLISIGYSSCHWCHVMEKEVFSNEEVAQIMNSHFICVKVDREERPDVDQIYMNAIQIITRSGGWPLNCFALPDGRPVFGGTYFPKQGWVDILQGLNATWQSDPLRVVEVANELTQGIKKTEVVKEKEDLSFEGRLQLIDGYVRNWEKYFDCKNGGTKGVPKFPLPGSIEFLLRYSALKSEDSIKEFVNTTLNQIANGGIYDHLGGGFFRYSVDERWEVPHFEKMLYDNAQLLQLYSLAYSTFSKEEFKRVVYETAQFLFSEMQSTEGGFYSAIDADSEGVEGAFYTWSQNEIDTILGENKNLFSIVYGVSAIGNHKGKSVLRKCTKISEAACVLLLDAVLAQKRLVESRELMLKFRNGRQRPITDDKIIASWNALLASAFINAYISFNDEMFLNKALQIVSFIESYLIDNGNLLRIRCKGLSKINGFLDDYAMLIETYISLYKVTFNEAWLAKANKMAEYVLRNFYDDKSGMLFYSLEQHDHLIVRKMELADGVIPSSSAVMAENFFALGVYLRNEQYLKTSDQMLVNMQKQLVVSGPYVFRWASLLLKKTLALAEVGFASNYSRQNLIGLLSNCQYYPNLFPYLGSEESDLAIVNRTIAPNSYQLCLGNRCLPKTTRLEDIIKAITENKLYQI